MADVYVYVRPGDTVTRRTSEYTGNVIVAIGDDVLIDLPPRMFERLRDTLNEDGDN